MRARAEVGAHGGSTSAGSALRAPCSAAWNAFRSARSGPTAGCSCGRPTSSASVRPSRAGIGTSSPARAGALGRERRADDLRRAPRLGDAVGRPTAAPCAPMRRGEVDLLLRGRTSRARRAGCRRRRPAELGAAVGPWSARGRARGTRGRRPAIGPRSGIRGGRAWTTNGTSRGAAVRPRSRGTRCEHGSGTAGGPRPATAGR